MKTVHIILAICLMASATVLSAKDDAGLWMRNGKNEVKISVINAWERDLNGISFEVAKELLPAWLEIEEAVQTLNIPKETKNEKQLILTFTLKEAPEGAFAEIPLILKDLDGNRWDFITTVNVTGGAVELPRAFSLSQNSPNPFNPSTTITYAVPAGEQVHVSIKVYDIRGRLIRIIVEDTREPGNYNVFWDGSDENGLRISSGVYFYRMKAGNFDQTRKMVVLK